jgi:hypothetical protein
VSTTRLEDAVSLHRRDPKLIYNNRTNGTSRALSDLPINSTTRTSQVRLPRHARSRGSRLTWRLRRPNIAGALHGIAGALHGRYLTSLR